MSAKASENRGAREPATWIYVSHKFMRLRGPFFRSRIPFANLPPSPLPSFYPSPSRALFPPSPAHSGIPRVPPRPTNPSRLRSVCYLLSSEISRSICYRGGGYFGLREFASLTIHALVAVTKTEIVTLQTYHGGPHVLVNVKCQFNTSVASCIIHTNIS